ncbi:ATP-dependent translocase ABCB1 [Taenia crassiceps]|uniref:ATP-dependent translocase ABCB1 n=1 Tax=Taenia crassiceps TaxID=6207 RepID=A0ABR4QGZ5_9CEST
MVILVAVTFAVAYIQMSCLVLRQDAAWFDGANVGGLITRLTEGGDKVEAGLGEKAGVFVQNLFAFTGGTVISLVKNWELVSAAFFLLVGTSFAAVGSVVRKMSAKERAAHSRASGIAGEALGAVRAIFAPEGQERGTKRYAEELPKAERVGLKRSSVFGFDASICLLMAVAFYHGIVMPGRGTSDPGEVILVVLVMLCAKATVGQAFQEFEHFNFAVAAAGEIFPITDRAKKFAYPSTAIPSSRTCLPPILPVLAFSSSITSRGASDLAKTSLSSVPAAQAKARSFNSSNVSTILILVASQLTALIRVISTFLDGDPALE